MTTAWTDGYQTEVNYTFGYYKDLSPNFQKFCLLLNGVDCSSADVEYNHCELGFGQGVSLNVHATSNFGTFPSFSILYKYRSEIPTRAVSSSTVKPDLSRAVLMISPSVSGRFCTVRSPPYIIIWIPFMLIMAQPFNYW